MPREGPVGVVNFWFPGVFFARAFSHKLKSVVSLEPSSLFRGMERTGYVYTYEDQGGFWIS